MRETRPTARILLLMTRFRSARSSGVSQESPRPSSSSSNSSLVQMSRRDRTISVTNGSSVSLRMGYRERNRTLLADKWQTPREYIHEIREPVWMRGGNELPDIEDIIFILENSRLVVVNIEIVWAREKCHDSWEACPPRLSIHPVPGITRRVNMPQQKPSTNVTPYPASWASCALIIDNSLFLSRNWLAT